jgi:hypothetical protein
VAKNKVDECMFCGANPCECSGKPKRKFQTKVEKLTPFDPGLDDLKPEPVSRGSRLARMKDAARTAPPPPVSVAPAPRRGRSTATDTAAPTGERFKNVARSLDQDTVVLNAAIRALNGAGLLSEDQQQEYVGAISTPPTTDEEILLWKLRQADNSAHS